MSPIWTDSADKHGVSHTDAAHAVAHSTYERHLNTDPDGWTVWVFIGPEHSATTRELEVLLKFPPRPIAPMVVFHVMPLGPKYRRLREEFPNDDRSARAARRD
jgi:hypothetical protein